MTDRSPKGAVTITPLGAAELQTWLEEQPKALARWVSSSGFEAKPGSVSLFADQDGKLNRVLLGVEEADATWDWAALPGFLPPGTYRVDPGVGAVSGGREANRAALGWSLGTYRFRRSQKPAERELPTLVWPKRCDRARVARAVRATFLVRDLINTPANALGPEELAEAARALARRRGARCRVVVGDALLRGHFPAIHAVGRGSPRAPRLIDLRWGAPSNPRVTLVGKGVCFDSGGLDLKPAAAMKLMKKDMGGAANLLGLGDMIMDAGIPVRLRILIPAVENSVSGASLRPLDVVATRRGLTVEIGNTDAEGRVILADALAEASRERPALIVDCATLTGAARVALGPELPALFCTEDGFADDLVRHGEAEGDRLWRMPLFQPYRKLIDGKVADLTNAADVPHAGAITAALFLREFVDPGLSWVHIDMSAWNMEGRPGRPEGGEAMGMRALFSAIEERFAGPKR
jgi:leucyl aminopeptidase